MSWVRVTNGEIPANAMIGGYEEDGSPLYIARAEHEGGHHPGKVSRALGACHFGFGGKEVAKREYEVLCCNARELALVSLLHFHGSMHYLLKTMTMKMKKKVMLIP